MPRIVKTDNVLGSNHRIDGHRIGVFHVYLRRVEGDEAPEEIASKNEISVAEVPAALGYAFSNLDDIRAIEDAHQSRFESVLRRASFPTSQAETQDGRSRGRKLRAGVGSGAPDDDHDAVRAVDSESLCVSATDPDLLAEAARQNRVLLTADQTDFSNPPLVHPGILIIARVTQSGGEVRRAVHWIERSVSDRTGLIAYVVESL